MDVAAEARENDNTGFHSSPLTVDTPHVMTVIQILELCKDLFKKWSELEDSRFFIENPPILELLEACKAMAERDVDFVYDYTTDENDKVENIAWSYGDSVRAYTLFGDVVTFDTTYRSITYGLLLGVWFCMDNHGKAIFLGCVLLQDESSQSFTWALQTFIRFMRGRRPQTILTDIDSGLRDGIARELPNTKHVICIWHILSKLSSWFSLPLGAQYEDFKAEFNMLCHLEGVEDFEHQWFYSLLLRHECCSFSNGEYVKAGLAELEQWCYEATEEYAGSAWDELKHIRQAVGFLVIHQKPKKTLNEIIKDLCPLLQVLSIQQLYRISTMYWDDKYGTHSVSSDVISSMRILMTEDSNNAVSSSFLLDDDSSIPFTVDDISKSLQQVNIADVDPPALIRENSGFGFLLPRSE